MSAAFINGGFYRRANADNRIRGEHDPYPSAISTPTADQADTIAVVASIITAAISFYCVPSPGSFRTPPLASRWYLQR